MLLTSWLRRPNARYSSATVTSLKVLSSRPSFWFLAKLRQISRLRRESGPVRMCPCNCGQSQSHRNYSATQPGFVSQQITLRQWDALGRRCWSLRATCATRLSLRDHVMADILSHNKSPRHGNSQRKNTIDAANRKANAGPSETSFRVRCVQAGMR